VLEQREASLGRAHPRTLNAVDNLAVLFYQVGRVVPFVTSDRRVAHVTYVTYATVNQAGRYPEAEALYRRMLAGFEEHAQEAAAASRLGAIHNLAIVLHVQVTHVTYVTDVTYLGAIHNLAIVLHVQGKDGEAEPLYREELRRREEMSGPEHLDTLRSVNALAALLQATAQPARVTCGTYVTCVSAPNPPASTRVA
jgi:tetratricopeptide (TPR) repeat protein